MFYKNNLVILFCCQALFITIISVDLTYTGLVGYELAANKGLATFPYALITLLTAMTTLVAALVMKLIGRKKAFLIGAVLAIISGFTTFTAIEHKSFIVFCIGTASIGIFQAFAQYYRLAAADTVESVDKKHNAISTVLFAGVIAVIVGPTLLNTMIDTSSLDGIGKAYLLTMVMGILTFIVIYFFYYEKPLPINVVSSNIEQLPLIKTIRKPIYIAALSTNAISYAVMMFAMTATPIAMLQAGHNIHSSTMVIQVHMMGMFAMSYVTGKLISRYRECVVIYIGIFLNVLAACILIFFNSIPVFFVALFLIGCGWNFMFISGTSLLSKSYSPSQKYVAQSISEFTTFIFSALGSLSAGWVLHNYSWAVINISLIPLMIIPLITVSIYYFSAKK